MDEKRREKKNKFVSLLLKGGRIGKGYADSWYAHCRVFGDILRPAFPNDIAARFELVAALNLMTQGKYTAAAKKLDGILEYCSTDEDFAAWNFFLGVCCDRSGLSDMATAYYWQAAKREPAFYMVYLMLAKCLHRQKHYEAALAEYLTAADAIASRERADEVPAVREEAVLGSVHGNAANCLLMMRRYDDAEFELYEAERYGCENPMLTLTWAALYAATDRKAQCVEKMSRLRRDDPALESASALMVREIVERKNSRFALRSIPTDKLAKFWRWFTANEGRLHSFAMGTGSPFVMEEVYEQVGGIFDFGPERPGFDIGRDGEKARLSFYDNYNLTFEIWLERLVDTAPGQHRARWSFYSVH